MLKRVGTYLYCHRSNISELKNEISSRMYKEVIHVLNYADEMMDGCYEIIKVHLKSDMISLLDCATWNDYYEPIILGVVRFNVKEGTYRIVSEKVEVSPDKWRYVSEDYKGFDIINAKKRYEVLQGIPEIKDNLKHFVDRKTWCYLLDKYNLSQK